MGVGCSVVLGAAREERTGARAEIFFWRARAGSHEIDVKTMPPPEALPPDLLDGTAYIATARIASGGMGDVVEARHRWLGVRVVVKLLREEHLREPSIVERLVLEGRILATLDEHPHVVGIRDIGRTARGVPFLVLEPLRGTTLRDELVQRGFLPVSEAIAVVRQVLAALAAAHHQGFVHRDVKLDNVFVCRSGRWGEPRIKLLDFGVAKVLAERGAGAGWQRIHATSEGMLIGTPRVLAPEQLDPSRVGPATDIYAAGLMLYTLVVGRGPFDHRRLRRDLLRAHREEAPIPPSVVARQRLPEGLSEVIMKALQKRPEDRFSSAHAMGRALLALHSSTCEPGAEGAHAAPGPVSAARSRNGLGREEAASVASDTSTVQPSPPVRLSAWRSWRRRRAGWAVVALLGVAIGWLVVRVWWR